MFNWHKKEKPFLGYGGFGGVSTGLAFGGAGGAAVKATGGTVVEPGNGYVYHVFTSSGAIVADGADVPNVDWLVVAGGGAGGNYFGGGGGAGGAATDGSSGNGGPGGLGVQLPSTFRDPASTIGYGSGSPSSLYFVGGGGGGSAGPPAAKLAGGGGGAPTVPQPNQATDGSVPVANQATYQWAGAGFGMADSSTKVAPSALANSGSGGGGNGEGYPVAGRYGGNGGSGLVLIAYPT